MQEAECPKCSQIDQSCNIRAIVSSGSSSGTIGGGVGGFGRDGGFVGGGRARTTGATHLANRLAAPAHKSYSGLAILAGAVGLLMLFTGSAGAVLVGLSLIAFCVWLLKSASEKTKRNQALLTEWALLYYCQRCDIVWHPSTREPVAPEGRLNLIARVAGI